MPDSVSKPVFFDMHCHLDFAPNAQEAAAELSALGAGAFAVSVLPHEQGADCSSSSSVRWGAGLHPWWVADGRAGEAELEALLARIPSTIYIGEVGLDFGRRYAKDQQAMQRQIDAFTRIAQACAQAGGRVLSLHAAASAPDVFQVLEQEGTLDTCTCIFHWYSGDSASFHAAVQAKCFFSVNAFMLETKRGREYARQIPLKQLLLETDYPPEGQDYNPPAMQTQLALTGAHIAELRNMDFATLTDQLAYNSKKVLAL